MASDDDKKKTDDKGDDQKKTEESKTAEDKKTSEEDDDDAVPGTPSNKRRFFPRVKHLLTREWEYFLSGVLDSMETAEAPSAAAASHKASNPWYKAFDLVYGGVASDCSIPTGKNRFHKFKDKIVEIWMAMEEQAPDEHPLKAKAMEQLIEYRKACEEANKKETTKPQNKSMSPKTASSKRSYASTFPFPPAKWKHLDEGSALGTLPEPLKSLVHLRHLGTELGKKTENLETLYQNALTEYCQQAEEEKDKLYSRSLALAALFRQTQNYEESKEISKAYEKTVQDYVVLIDPSSAIV